MDGDRAVVRDILEIFLTGVPSDLKLLDDGMYQCNAKLVARQAHSIKGMTANVGAEATRHAAEALEAAVKQGDWDHARALFSQLTTTLHAASGAIRKELDVMTRVLPPVDGSRTADDAMNQTAPPPVQRPSDGPIRTLIVDDSAAMRGMLSRLLEPFPIEVIGQANSMEEAQRLTTELVPELLFLDVVMPGGSGIDLLHKLRDLPIPPAVVMLSSVAERATIVESKRCGAIDYLLKPFDSDTLRRCVARVHARLRKP
jgi:CheY-like chemotaxis protein/HPt (histidine-containing phosphotransfer) domain-containing protein